MSIDAPFNPNQHHVFTPDGRWRYQCWADKDGEEAQNLFTVWKLDTDGSWLVEMMIYLDETCDGPAQVGTDKDDAEESPDTYIWAAGHIWAAREAGLWD